MMNTKSIRKVVVDTIYKVQKKNITEKDFNTNLLSGEISITPAQLVYLFVFLEDKFKIKFEEQDVLNGKFNTINNIVDMAIKASVK